MYMREMNAIAGEGKANPSLTESGTLVYVQGAAADTAGSTLVWVDRDGHEEPIAAPPRAYVGPRISPDGTSIAVEIRESVGLSKGESVSAQDEEGIDRFALPPATFGPQPEDREGQVRRVG